MNPGGLGGTLQQQRTVKNDMLDMSVADSHNLDNSLVHTLPQNLPLTPSGATDLHRLRSINMRFDTQVQSVRESNMMIGENQMMMGGMDDGMYGEMDRSIVEDHN